MSNLINFQFQSVTNIRTLLINGEIWFVASDIATALDYRMASDMTRFLDDDEKATHNLRTPYGEQNFTIINESGLYSAILKSRKPEAKTFKKWVTSEVLPSIRKTGTYTAPTVQSNELTDKDWTNLKRLVWLCENNFKMQKSAGYAIWARLRAITGVKSPQKFSREHLPVLALELERIFRMSEQYRRAIQATEKLIIRNVLKYGDDEPMEFFLAELVEKATDYNQAKAERLPAFFGKELLELLELVV